MLGGRKESMELIDNITRLLGDDLKATLKPKSLLLSEDKDPSSSLQRPVNTGGRFSAKARCASFASSVLPI